MHVAANVRFKIHKLPILSSARYVLRHTAMGWRDEWPSGPDGSQYDGKQLMSLVHNNQNPFHGVWDVKLLVQEIEEKLNTQVTDIPIINKGSNNYVSSHLYIRSRITQTAHPCLGFSSENLEQTGHCGSSSSWRCQYA